MKMRATLFAALAVGAMLPVSAEAQNLFRTGRPDYAQTPQYESAFDHWRRPVTANRYADAIGRTTRFHAARPTNSSPVEFERMQTAWDNYRREAFRYQQRYGNSAFVSDDLSRPDNGYGREDRAPCRYRRDLRGNLGVSPADLPPTLSSGAGLRNRHSYERSLDARPYGGLRGRSITSQRDFGSGYRDPARTASRPVADFFRSLFPTQ